MMLVPPVIVVPTTLRIIAAVLLDALLMVTEDSMKLRLSILRLSVHIRTKALVDINQLDCSARTELNLSKSEICSE